MNQQDRREYLIQRLLAEREDYKNRMMPETEEEQWILLRSLLNVREPKAADQDFLRAQDEYLQAEIEKKGITDLAALRPVRENIYLWQGDITTLRADAIVNAANSQMLGCFAPCHLCIDNAIHTFAGVQLRLACARLMKAQGRPEPTGQAKITPAFNLPSKYVLHTVGPIISGPLSVKDCALLRSCYRSCLELAEENGLKSIAFCCISTGEFHFPNDRAAEIAVETVGEYQKETGSRMKVVFNVFKNEDLAIYSRILA